MSAGSYYANNVMSNRIDRIIHSADQPPRYIMRDPVGYAVIFYHEDLPGISHDLRRLTEVYTSFGFTVEKCKLTNSNHVLNTLSSYQSKKELENHSCFLMYILSIGEPGDKIIMKDGNELTEHCFWNNFTNKNCSSLRACPKIVCFEAPRLAGPVLPTVEFLYDAATIPDKSDIVLLWASVSGEWLPRTEEHGSWFIEELYNIACRNNELDLETWHRTAKCNLSLRVDQERTQRNSPHYSMIQENAYNARPSVGGSSRGKIVLSRRR